MTVRLPTRLPEVTPRQREVARLVTEGMTNGQIASELGITLDGAKYHVAELLGRLGLTSRAEIASWYREEEQARSRRRLRALFLGTPMWAGGAAALVAALALALWLHYSARLAGLPPAADEATQTSKQAPLPILDTSFVRQGGLWSRSFVATSPLVDPPALAVAPGGELVVAATFDSDSGSRSFDLGGGPLDGAGGTDALLAKVAPDGRHLWSRRLGGTEAETAIAVAVSSKGDIFAAGQYSASVNLGSGSLPPPPVGNGAWLAKFDASGDTKWARSLGPVRVDAVATEGERVLVAGTFEGDMDLGGRLRSAGGRDVVVAMFEQDGDLRWARSLGGPETEEDVAIAADGQLIALVATVGRDRSQDGGGRPAYIRASLLLAGLEAGSGAPRWQHTFGADGTALIGEDIALDGKGGAVVAASLAGRVDLGGGALEGGSRMARDIVVAKFARDGAHVWSKRFGDQFDDHVHALVTSPGAIHLAGIFRGRFDAATALESSINTEGNQSQDGFLARLDERGALTSVQPAGLRRSDRPQDLTVGARGEVYASGRFAATIDLGAGQLFSTQPFLDFFIARLTP